MATPNDELLEFVCVAGAVPIDPKTPFFVPPLPPADSPDSPRPRQWFLVVENGEMEWRLYR